MESGRLGVLARLLSDGVSVVGIVVRLKPTDPTLISIARGAGLPIFQPAKVNDVAFLEEHRKLLPDLNVSVSYDQIIRSGNCWSRHPKDF